MDVESIREFCLSLPGATEDVKWEKNLTFLIGEKMFAVVGLKPGKTVMSFKCTPASFAELVERKDIIPAPYLARHYWVGLENTNALGEKDLKRYLEISYQLVLEKLPKKVKDKIS
ncbi:MAG: MmcQ/YjbR family DNA-binding protein [Pyrinomonadaceae bacterium]|nr:MmcQ/YjbR family DNA-binding protein [Pyrinomonadaceae bacterium]